MKDYLGFKGKVCVVSGARTGVGKAAAEILDVYKRQGQARIEDIESYGLKRTM